MTDSAPEDYIIKINEMHKWYGQFHVLKNINLNVAIGERIVICGPSGSGKSTIIRYINRLEEHQQGQIIVDTDLLPYFIYKLNSSDVLPH